MNETGSTNSMELNEQDLYRIFDSIPAAVFIYDVKQLEVVYVNKVVKEITGYSFAEMKQMGTAILEKLLHPEDLKSYMDAAEELSSLKGEEIRNYSYRILTKDGRQLKLSAKRMVFKRDKDGKGVQVLSMSEVTD